MITGFLARLKRDEMVSVELSGAPDRPLAGVAVQYDMTILCHAAPAGEGVCGAWPERVSPPDVRGRRE